MGGYQDGSEKFPDGIGNVIGTCKDSQRRGICIHTLAAASSLLKALEDKASPFREQLFHLRETEEWRTVLKLVDQFLVAAPQPDEQAQAPQTRVVWRVQYQTDAAKSTSEVRFEITPFEQKSGKGGQWTKGRKLSLEQFARLGESLSSDADCRIAAKYNANLQSSYA